jgi:hypothetical protein
MLRNNGRHNFRSPFGIQPSLVLDFAGTGTLDSRVTFTRSTTGTYYNSSGVLTTAAINAPRFDYNPSTLAPLGLLIEQSSTNLLTYSQDFTNAIWTKDGSSITASANIAPDGTQTASALIESTTTAVHRMYCSATVSLNTDYTLSFYAKANGRNLINVIAGNSSGQSTVVFDLSGTGSVGITTGTPNALISAVGNGWFRCSLKGQTSSGTTWYAILNIQTVNQSSPQSYTGNGYSGVYIWGAQLEALAFPTSYIPTTSAQVTRAADNASMTGTNFSSWYNATQGTVYSEAAGSTITGSSGIYSISDGTGSNRIVSSFGASMFYVMTGGVQQVVLSVGADTINTFAKYAGFFSTNNFAFTRNGATPQTASSGSIPTVNRMYIGASADGTGGFLNGRIKKLSYYPQALTSAQLQALTT